ncbi:MAG: hypothetical protein ABI912_05785 [Actinomycetota bacterium]
MAGWPGGPSSGPFKKIAAQTAAWADAGIDVGLFVLTDPAHADAWRAVTGIKQVVVRSRGPRVALQKERLLLDVQRWAPDVIYHRWSMTYPGLVFAAWRRIVVVEINTDDVAEYDLMSPIKGILNRATRGLVLRHAAGLVFVTDELSRFPVFARYRRPSAIVANGITLDDVPQRPAPESERPRLLLIGQPNSPWHGIDKVFWLARQKPDWDFEIVGPHPAELLGAPANVHAHGLLHAQAYGQLLASADVGIGTLALHRKGLNEASTLKVREYLAAGLPVVLGYLDTDFPDGADCLLQLPNVENNVVAGLHDIEKFVARWKGHRVARADVAHLDYSVKEHVRLAFFRSLIPEPAKP